MSKQYTCLGMMSGTSGDGVDASIISSDGQNYFKVLKEKYYEYDNNLFVNFHDLKKKVNTKNVSSAVKFLIENDNITGQIINVDSGQRLAWKTPDIINVKE